MFQERRKGCDDNGLDNDSKVLRIISPREGLSVARVLTDSKSGGKLTTVSLVFLYFFSYS